MKQYGSEFCFLYTFKCNFPLIESDFTNLELKFKVLSTDKINFNFGMRMIAKDVCITRPISSNGIYKMLNHTKSERNPLRESLLFTSVINEREYSLYTHLLIDVGERDPNYFEQQNSNSYASEIQN
ncbi:hypothetical protein BpHYR1_000379 [Brachionus plicatilis]|uniref:Uncharacterized protein n=1 Tax=Brachionus plicatilis TaxID=10195 RepID=A0A3M7Q674_BRAPC|nr:hypothetical protein BpHYR1_000379 [Brachionus plicatilis]